MAKEERRCSKVPRSGTATTRARAKSGDWTPSPTRGVPGAEAGDIAGEDVKEGAGDRKAAASPEIGEDANKGETQHPAPDDEVGVPENPGGSGDEG